MLTEYREHGTQIRPSLLKFSRYCPHALGSYSFDNEIIRAKITCSWSEIALALEAAGTLPLPEIHKNIVDDLNFGKQRFIDNAKHLDSIKKDPCLALIASGVTIGSSLVLLAFTPIISKSESLALIVLAADVSSACFCLWTYFGLVKSLVDGKPSKVWDRVNAFVNNPEA